MLTITSPAFSNEGPIPRAHTCDGADLSPPLTWAGAPTAAKELSLICEDPDAPGATFVHWVVYGLPPTLSGLPSGVPKEATITKPPAKQGMTDFRRVGYGGPCPPRGPAHRYYFTLYALDTSLGVPPGATKAVLLKAMEGHVIEQAQTMGKYGRT